MLNWFQKQIKYCSVLKKEYSIRIVSIINPNSSFYRYDKIVATKITVKISLLKGFKVY